MSVKQLELKILSLQDQRKTIEKKISNLETLHSQITAKEQKLYAVYQEQKNNIKKKESSLSSISDDPRVNDVSTSSIFTKQ